MTAPHLKKSIGRSPSRRGVLLIVMMLASFALSQMALAVSPAPGGGYLNYNTAGGDGALFSLTDGRENTAFGFNALYSDTFGYYNTANGYQALFSNTTGNDNTATGYQALFSTTTGFVNTANGYQALS